MQSKAAEPSASSAISGGVPNNMYHNPKTGLKTYILSFEDSDTRLELMTRPEVKIEEEDIYRQGFIHLSFSVGSKEKVDNLTKILVPLNPTTSQSADIRNIQHKSFCVCHK